MPRVVRRQLRARAATVPTSPNFTLSGGVEFYPGSDTPRALPHVEASAAHQACIAVKANAVVAAVWRAVDAAGMDVPNEPMLMAVRGPVEPGEMTHEERLRMVAENLFGTGNAYLRNDNGDLTPARRGTVRIENRRRVYQLELANGARVELPPDQVIAIHGPGFNGVMSPSPIQRAGIQTGKLYSEAGASILNQLRNSLSGRAVLVASEALLNSTSQQAGELVASLGSNFQGARNQGRPFVVPAGMTPASFDGDSPADMQIAELLQFTTEDICRIHGVPPRMVFQYSQQLRVRGFEAQAADFQRFTVAPDCQMIGAAYTRGLMGGGTTRLVLDSAALGQGSFGETADTLHRLVAGGILTPNEARRRLGEDDHANGNTLSPPAGTPQRARASDDE